MDLIDINTQIAGRASTRDDLLDQTCTLLFAIDEIGEATTQAIRQRVGQRYTSNMTAVALGALAQRGECRPRDLQSIVHAPSGTMARVLDHLEEYGDVVRLARRCPEDKRAIIVRLTDQGRQVERDIVAALVSCLDEIRVPLHLIAGWWSSIGDQLPSGTAESSTNQHESTVLALGRLGVILTEMLASSLDNIEHKAALVLCLLQRSDGRVRPITVSTLLRLSTGATSKLLDRMQAAGFVERSYGVVSEDRRGVEVSMTPGGQSRLALISTRLTDRSADVAEAFRLFEDLLEQSTR